MASPRFIMSASGAEEPRPSARLDESDICETVEAALNAGAVTLAFQPVVGARSGEIPFHEALIRVVDDAGRVVPAGRFMRHVEAETLGRRIDCASLALALSALAARPTLRLSVNMSARSMGYPRWTALLEDALERRPDIAGRLILEMTERSVMLLPELAQDFMSRGRERGIVFALDGFGAGRTDLRALRRLRFDMMKIDGSFTRGCDADAENQGLLEILLGLAATLDMMTVAEKVETNGEAAFLRALGIDCLQGYHIAPPEMRPEWLPDPARPPEGI